MDRESIEMNTTTRDEYEGVWFIIAVLLFGVFFFFSSRRRHTRSLCDWSSDVCSSDLFYGNRYVFADLVQNSFAMNTRFNITFSPNLTLELFVQPLIAKIGRASCRERV